MSSYSWLTSSPSCWCPGVSPISRSRVCRPGALKLGAIGYALGSVLEILAFALTAALHARGALWAYPPVVIVAALLVARRRDVRGAQRDAPAGGPMSWALAALCVAALGYIVVALLPVQPATGAGRAASSMSPSSAFHLGVAAEALHHWPISDPKVAGVALPYEDFIYFKSWPRSAR